MHSNSNVPKKVRLRVCSCPNTRNSLYSKFCTRKQLFNYPKGVIRMLKAGLNTMHDWSIRVVEWFLFMFAYSKNQFLLTHVYRMRSNSSIREIAFFRTCSNSSIREIAFFEGSRIQVFGKPRFSNVLELSTRRKNFGIRNDSNIRKFSGSINVPYVFCVILLPTACYQTRVWLVDRTGFKAYCLQTR